MPLFTPVRTLGLSKPIRYGPDELTELHFREPTADIYNVVELHQSRMARGKAQFGTITTLIGYITGTSAAAISTLALIDGVAAQAILEDLLDECGMSLRSAGADGEGDSPGEAESSGDQ